MVLGCAAKMVQRSLKSCHLQKEVNNKDVDMDGKTLPAEGTQSSKALRGESVIGWRNSQEDRLAGTDELMRSAVR